MALEADLLIDRRRLKRNMALWRGLALLLLVAAAALAGRVSGGLGGLPGEQHVARLSVSGVITEDRRLLEALERARKDARVRALLVSIDSPGGTVSGGEALHHALARMAEAKPVVAVMRGTAASAGYMVALPAQRIIAREATVTGSIGVLLQTPDVSELMARVGVRMETLVSGPLKDQPNPFHPLSPAGRAALDAVIRDLFDQFVAMVAKGRKMEEAEVRALADGRVFTGRQALAAGLVDAIGGEAEARAWLAAERGVSDRLPMRDIETRGRAERLLEAISVGFTKTLISEWLGVDGFRALWQP
jgi:protease-4